VLALDQLGTTPTFIFFAVSLAAFVLAVVGIAVHEKLTNLVALGLAAFVFPYFWNAMAAL
jgi:hypothetical protein